MILSVPGSRYKQSFKNSSFDQMLFHQFGNVRRFEINVNDAFRVDHHDGAQSAKTVAACFHDFYFFSQFPFDEFFQKGIFDAETAGSLTPSASAN